MRDHDNPGPRVVNRPNTTRVDREFDAILYPNRSLSIFGFRLLMVWFGAVSFGVGTFFFMIGAWPITGFFGLDVAVMYWAFHASYKSGRLFEQVRLSGGVLGVRRVEPNGRESRWEFPRSWVQVHMDDPPRPESPLVLSAHGVQVAIGGFLTPDERLDLAWALKQALTRMRPFPGTARSAATAPQSN